MADFSRATKKVRRKQQDFENYKGIYNFQERIIST